MEFWQGFLLITGVHLLGAASPGPDFVLVSQVSIRQGRAAGVWCALGIALGLSVHIIYSVAGLATIIAHSDSILYWVKVLGASYLVYLGISGLRSGPRQLDLTGEDSTQASGLQWVTKGFICNALNPKAPLYFLSVFTIILTPDLPLWQLSVYGVWMMVIQMLWFGAVAAFLSAPVVQQKISHKAHWFDRGLGLILVILGGNIFASLW